MKISKMAIFDKNRCVIVRIFGIFWTQNSICLADFIKNTVFAYFTHFLRDFEKKTEILENFANFGYFVHFAHFLRGFEKVSEIFGKKTKSRP